MSASGRLGILGGTFDPIHLGHLGAALAARQARRLDRVLLVPSASPPHRHETPAASADQRLAMVRLAVAGLDGLEASDLELGREGPSFTSHTLRALLASGVDRLSLHFIIGTDAFAEIATWHDYPAVVALAHFVVIARPGHDFTALGRRLPDLAPRMRLVSAWPGPILASRGVEPAGDHTPLDSRAPADPPDPTIWLVESATPDVSSTQVRERVRGGRPLAGLVPPLVERYIRRRGLYRPAPDGSRHGQEATHA